MLVDSHCHLDFDDLSGDLDAVLARAAAAEVVTMVTICTKITEFDRVRIIAEAHDHIFCSVGIHPHNAESEPVTSAAELIKLAEHPKVIGIGETGLDYYYDFAPREAQRNAFIEHITAARETGLPLIIHSRDADDDMAEILTDEMGKGAFPALMHCFSSSPALGRTAIELGLTISLSGIITFKNAEEVRELAAEVPLDKLLVETDAPYLAPIPHRGKTNEPAFVAHTCAKLAELHGIGAQEMAAQTTDNFFKLFTKASRP